MKILSFLIGYFNISNRRNREGSLHVRLLSPWLVFCTLYFMIWLFYYLLWKIMVSQRWATLLMRETFSEALLSFLYFLIWEDFLSLSNIQVPRSILITTAAVRWTWAARTGLRTWTRIMSKCFLEFLLLIFDPNHFILLIYWRLFISCWRRILLFCIVRIEWGLHTEEESLIQRTILTDTCQQATVVLR